MLHAKVGRQRLFIEFRLSDVSNTVCGTRIFTHVNYGNVDVVLIDQQDPQGTNPLQTSNFIVLYMIGSRLLGVLYKHLYKSWKCVNSFPMDIFSDYPTNTQITTRIFLLNDIAYLLAPASAYNRSNTRR